MVILSAEVRHVQKVMVRQPRLTKTNMDTSQAPVPHAKATTARLQHIKTVMGILLAAVRSAQVAMEVPPRIKIGMDT